MRTRIFLCVLFALVFSGSIYSAVRIIPNTVYCPQTQLFYESSALYRGNYLDFKQLQIWEAEVLQKCDKKQKSVLADVKKKYSLDDLTKADFEGALSYCRAQAIEGRMLGNREWEGIIIELIMRKHMGLTVVQRSTNGNTSKTFQGFDVTNLVSAHNEKYGLKLAQEGDVGIQMVMGGYYEGQATYNLLNGNSKVVSDYNAKSAYWYEQAAKKGDVLSQYKTGILYMFGHGVKQNYSKAAEWFGIAAKNGHVDAAYLYGVACYLGKGVLQNKENAQSWFEKAAKKGHIEASFMYGYMQYLNYESRNDGYQEKVVPWLEFAAKNGNQQAQYFLAYCYTEIAGIRDFSKAIRWYDMACTNKFYWVIGFLDGISHYFTISNNIVKYIDKNGFTTEAYKVLTVAPASYYNRGEIYIKNHDKIAQNWEQTLIDWKFAANYFEFWVADYRMGKCYMDGLCGMTKNEADAKAWMCKAVKDTENSFLVDIPDKNTRNSMLASANEICNGVTSNEKNAGYKDDPSPNNKDNDICNECVKEGCKNCKKCGKCKECSKKCKDPKHIFVFSHDTTIIYVPEPSEPDDKEPNPRNPNHGHPVLTDKNIVVNMIYVKPGTFMMGCNSEQDANCTYNEKPVHEVTMDGFYISHTEVTQALWQEVMGTNPSAFQSGGNYPVDKISWNDCQVFVQRLNQLTGMHFDIPTEAQWEYAARGGHLAMENGIYLYAGGNEIDALACYQDGTEHYTLPVASKQPNELGIYDMSGNVMEWCKDKMSAYTAESQMNPHGGVDGENYVLRGGSWRDEKEKCRVTYRYSSNPMYKMNTFGLRLVLIP